MLNAAVQQVIKEMRSHPVTLLLVIGLLGVAIWGWTNYARAADLETIKAELKQEMSTLARRISTNNSKIDRGYKLQLAESIRGLQRQICEVEDQPTREGLQSTLDGLQEDYKDIDNGIEYPVSECHR